MRRWQRSGKHLKDMDIQLPWKWHSAKEQTVEDCVERLYFAENDFNQIEVGPRGFDADPSWWKYKFNRHEVRLRKTVAGWTYPGEHIV